MPHVDILCDRLQSYNVEATTIQVALNNFYKAIESIREKMNEEPENLQNNRSTSRKRKRVGNSNITAKEECHTICVQARDEFKFLGHLSAAKPFLSHCFSQFRKEFPYEALHQTAEAYLMMNKEKLQTQLKALYESSKVSGAVELHNLILSHELKTSSSEIFSQKIILTTALTTSESG